MTPLFPELDTHRYYSYTRTYEDSLAALIIQIEDSIIKGEKPVSDELKAYKKELNNLCGMSRMNFRKMPKSMWKAVQSATWWRKTWKPKVTFVNE
jgi:hypothetical protein